MTVQATVTLRDLKRLEEFGDSRRSREAGEPLPWSVLRELAELVPCDSVNYLAMDPYRQRLLAGQDFMPASDVAPAPCSDAELESMADSEEGRFFWQHYWNWGCSYPERSGDCASVIRSSDFDDDDSLAEYLRMIGVCHGIVVPLPPRGPVARRVHFWRDDGGDFSDRERLLLMLARPRLVEMQEASMSDQGGAAALSPRQRELMRVVAAGLTNRQIGRRMLITDGTVRKHLENIYRVLGVTNRVEAVAVCGATAQVAIATGG
ncbi:MAG: helix-turn-helix transcriptional regulator [Actinomycetota bacterium]|nr:helix-turn-helix transcriptional regulator [Actinomycetota bacterium]